MIPSRRQKFAVWRRAENIATLGNANKILALKKEMGYYEP